jgi:putative ABC transport system permease protein
VAGKKIEVVGVLKKLGSRVGMISVDESVIIPSTTAEKSILGTRGQVMITTTVDNVDNTALATSSITTVLRTEHNLKASQEDDFRIMDAGSMVAAAQASAKTMTALLTAIAAITLLVSGIGIMNVMFVTVAERTKEIGIAKAIGGKRTDILSQFLLESVILSMVGGLIGMTIGQVAIPIISYFDLISMASSWTGPIIGFTFSVLVGIFFGFYPAFKASRLDPVDALRSE